LESGPYKHHGPTAEALKRFFWRVGVLKDADSSEFTQEYGKTLWGFVAQLKINQKMRTASQRRDGSYTKQVWEHIRGRRVPAGQPHAGEYALDPYSRKIVQDEAGDAARSQKLTRVQERITEFWNIAIRYNSIWHYSQDRPADVSVDPAKGGRSDCSMMVVQAHNYAKRMSGVMVPDPSKWEYRGYGNTDWYEDDWPRIGAPFRVGDLAHFHSERHVIECIKAGDFHTAVWGSNGGESAPDRISGMVNYYRFPNEYMFTVRPSLTDEEVM
jgi:hypothetical protein